jgi:iron complex outermembrane receptor protein
MRGSQRAPLAAALVLVAAPHAVRADEPPETDAPEEAREEPAIDVTVEGGVPTESSRDPSAAVYVLRRRTLGRPGMTLAEALARVPGAQSVRTGGAADVATTTLRGATSAQTPVYLAGMRLNDDLTGTADLSTVPAWMLERVEVYRGSAPLDADRFGMGGAVMLEPTVPRGIGASSAFGFGSFGAREASAAASLGRRSAGALLALRAARGDGDYAFVDDGGTRFDDSDDVVRRRANADHRELDAWTVGRLSRGPTTVVTTLNAFRREQGAPGLALVGTHEARSDTRRLLGALSSTTSCGTDALGCRLEVDAGALVTRYRLADPLRELGASTLTEVAGERGTGRLRVRLEPLSWLALGLGTGLEEQWLRSDSDAGGTLRARRHVVRPEAHVAARFADRVEATGAVAVPCHITATSLVAGDGCADVEPTGRLGVRVEVVPELHLLANGGRYQRVPTLGELYGTSSVAEGNPELVPEDGWLVDVGVAASAEHPVVSYYAQLFGFARFADELIAYRRSSFATVRPYNLARARVLGAELAAGLSLWHVHAGGALTLLDPRDQSDDRPTENDLVPFLSRLVTSSELELWSPPWPLLAIDRAAVGAEVLYRSARVADPAGLLVLASDVQLDFEASLAFVRHLTLRARLANVLDARAFDFVGYPLPGRSGHMRLEAAW